MTALATITTSLHGFFHWVTNTSSDGGPLAVDQFARNRRATYTKVLADAAAGTATAETCFYIDSRVAGGGTVTAVKYVPSAALTADNTDYVTITVRWRTSAGTGGATLASAVTTVTAGLGNMAALTLYPLTMTATLADRTFTAGAMFTIEIAKGGSGKAVPAGTLVVEYVEN